jgi:hypothetical protein
LLPWWWVQDHWITVGEVRWAALGVALAAAAVFVLLPRRYVLALPALVGVYFVLTTIVVENGRHGIHQASLGKLWSGIRVAQPNWIDRTVGPDASVTILRNALTADETVWENEFFNRSVRAVDAYGVTRVPDPLPEKLLTRNRAGNLGVHVQYVLGQDVVGKVVASDPQIGVNLYRVDGPLVVAATRVRGLYPDDTWSGRRVTYERTHCAGGTLAVQLGSDPSLFSSVQTVTAFVGLRPVARARIEPMGSATLRVPLSSRSDVCTVQFLVGRTAVPGHGDARVLGAHFFAFDYTP